VRRTATALLFFFLATAANPAYSDLTTQGIIARMFSAYAHADAYSDSGSVDSGESWLSMAWHLIRRGRAYDEFRTMYVRGRTLRFVYSSTDGRNAQADRDSDLIALAGSSHGASTAVPFLLLNNNDAPLRRLNGWKRSADTTVRGARCFTVSGTLNGGGVHATYTLHIDRRTYFLTRITREMSAGDAVWRETIDYLRVK